MRRFHERLLIALMVCVFACTAAWAQGTGQINGVVKDQSGAVLPGAEVTATQTETGVTRTSVSNETGNFILPNLPVGPYRIEVGLPGFRTYVQTGIVLQVNGSPSISAVLEVGQVSEQVEVQADATMVETRSTGVGAVIENTRVLELPLNGRNVQELVYSIGAVVVGRTDNTQGVGKNYPVLTLSVAGGGTTSMTYTMDGGTYNDPENNLTMPLPFPDALQEFKVETSAVPAQYGLHGAASVSVVTKSGTNTFHGSLFEFVRNYKFNARPFFAATRDSLKRNQFGGTIGGPIKKDKLFFFGGIQASTIRSAPAITPTFVPTAAMKAGDFTTFLSPACNSGTQRTVRNPTGYTLPGFTNGRINPAEFSPAAVKYINLLPAATNDCGLTFYALRSDQDEQQWLGRIDYTVSDKHTIFGRYFGTRLIQPIQDYKANILNANRAGARHRYDLAVIGSTYLISPNVVNQFRVTGNRTWNIKLLGEYLNLSDLGVNVFSAPQPTRYPFINVSGGPSVGSGMFFTQYPTVSYQFVDDISWVKGAHQIGFGANWIHSAMNSNLGNMAHGRFDFTGAQTGLGMTDLFLGRSSVYQQNAFTGTQNRLDYIGLYAQDSWKVTPRLTMNYGLRWDPYLPVAKKHDYMAHLDINWMLAGVRSKVWPLAGAGVLYPGDTMPDGKVLPRAASYADWMNFAPRLGLAWDVRGDGRTSVRAAYGLFYDLPQLFWINANQHQPGWGYQVQLGATSFEDPWANFPGGNPYPHVRSKDRPFREGATHYTFPLHHQSMYTQQWNLSVQQQFGTNWLASATYIGNNVIHMWTAFDENPATFIPGNCVAGQYGLTTSGPCSSTANYNNRREWFLANPNEGRFYGRIYSSDEGGTQNYNGMLLALQRRFAAGSTISANYTWSHCIGDIQNPEAGNIGYADKYNRAFDRGNCALVDRRHLFNVSAVALMPSFANTTLRTIASGWRASLIFGYQTGTFNSVTTGADTTLTGQTEGPQPRPNQVLASIYPEQQTINNWVNRAAFVTPAAGVYGNAGASTVRLPGATKVDVGISRIFSIRETQKLEVRAEAFNVINKANFGAPNLSLTSNTFGRILTTSDPRIMQFALKYNF
jgi:Carboxypeptidase regulatory-like domain/TonB dependent receptor